MHNIEPFYNWQHLYNSEEDELSPYFGEQHSEFQFTKTVYNYYVHPQWDGFGSENLYIKVLFIDYEDAYCILEFIGEWNDAFENDSALLKRNLIDVFIKQGIYKYICITENVLQYHNGDVDYYEEWFDDIKDEGGFITWLNLPEQSQYDFVRSSIKQYVILKEIDNWRTLTPQLLLEKVEQTLLLS